MENDFFYKSIRPTRFGVRTVDVLTPLEKGVFIPLNDRLSWSQSEENGRCFFARSQILCGSSAYREDVHVVGYVCSSFILNVFFIMRASARNIKNLNNAGSRRVRGNHMPLPFLQSFFILRQDIWLQLVLMYAPGCIWAYLIIHRIKPLPQEAIIEGNAPLFVSPELVQWET